MKIRKGLILIFFFSRKENLKEEKKNHCLISPIFSQQPPLIDFPNQSIYDFPNHFQKL